MHQERTGQKTLRSRAFPPPTLPRSPTIFLTAPLSYDAVAIHLGQCEKLRRYRKLATSSLENWLMTCARVDSDGPRPWSGVQVGAKMSPEHKIIRCGMHLSPPPEG